MGKKILVTGGAGFIGSNFIKYMLKKHRSYKIINLDLLTYAGNLKNLKEVNDNRNYQFIKGDICDGHLLDKLVRDKVDYIINFAAESHVDRSIKNPPIFTRTNIMGTQVLLDIARKYNIERFIQISTDEVYGSIGKRGTFTEKSLLNPSSPYSASKACADLLVKSYHKTFNLPINITRCSNNYGPKQYPEKLIPLVISNALEDKALPVYGDGLQVRDWLYVEDHCQAIDLVLHKGRTGEIYNIGTNNERTNLEIIEFILREMDKPLRLIKNVQDRPGHDRRYAINSEKIKKETGWRPLYFFEDGLRATIHWYIRNRNGE